ncbi:MAG: peptidase S41, partial [Sphingorhabdus sp.]
PMGMRGIGRATIVGTRMMGLGAAVFTKTLKQTGVSFQFSVEPVYDVQDRPRWQMEPDVSVGAGDDSLTAAISVLAAKL